MIFGKLIEKLGTRERLGLFLAGLCLFTVLVDRLVIQAVVDKLAELDVEIEKKENELRYSRGVLRGSESITKEYEVISQLALRATSSAKTMIMDELMGQIYNLAIQAGMINPSTKHHEPVETKSYMEYSVEVVGFQADMPDLIKFLHSVQAEPGLMTVSWLTLGPGKDKQVAGSMLLSKVVMLEKEEEPLPAN